MVRLEIPAELRFRPLVMRTVAAACRVARTDQVPADDDPSLELSEEFDAQMLSAVSEAFNNICIHGFKSLPQKNMTIEADVVGSTMEIRLLEFGESMNPALIKPPDLDALPERGMGLFIIRSFVDQFDYTAGSPNVWSFKKRLPAA